MHRRIKVLYIITRMVVGGAQQSAMLTADMLNKERFDVLFITGPQTGSEGELISDIIKRGISLEIFSELVRNLSPIRDCKALWKLYRFILLKEKDLISFILVLPNRGSWV